MPSAFRRLAIGGALALVGLAATDTAAHAAGLGVASPASGRLDLVLRHDNDGASPVGDTDSLVAITRHNGSWVAPINLGGNVHPDSEIGLSSPVENELDLVVRGTDNSLQWRHWTLANGWEPWAQLAAGLTGGPSLATSGGGNQVIAWRGASGNLVVRTWGPRRAVSLLTLANTVRAGTGPTISANAAGVLSITYLDATSNRPVRIANNGGLPTQASTWGGLTYLLPTGSTVSSTAAVAGGLRNTPVIQDAGGLTVWGSGYLAGSGRAVARLAPATGGTPARTITLGGTVAGSPSTARSGESPFRNTPAAVWSHAQGSVSPRLDVLWRTDNGCVSTRSTTSATSPDSSLDWTHPGRINTPLVNLRCVWPGRGDTGTLPLTAGTVPLMKRLDGSEGASLGAAHNLFWNDVPDGGQTAFYRSRMQALVLHDTGDWQSSWSPRNWHDNTWVYRKGSAFQAEGGVHTAPATSGLFARLTGTGQLAAVNYECYVAPAPAGRAVGCSQPLLNVTLTAAQNFWLYGATTNADGSFGSLRTGPPTTSGAGCADAWAHRFDGVLYKLACGYRGVWVDDAFTDLTSSRSGVPESRVANFVTGARLSNADVRTGGRLPFTPDAWANGMATMLERLRSGIAAMKAGGVIGSGAGLVALNYKWTQHGYAEVGDANGAGTGADPQITSLPAAAARAIRASDLIEMEGGAVSDGLQPGPVSTDYSYARHRQFVQQVHGLGRGVIQEMTDSADFAEFQTAGQRWDPPQADPNSCRQNVHPTSAGALAYKFTAAQYNLATTLIDYQPGDWVGDMCQYWGSAWDGYSTDLGAPLEAATTISGGVLRRRFQRGIVLVAPPGVATSTVYLGQQMLWRPNAPTQTAERVTQVTLDARRGAVLSY